MYVNSNVRVSVGQYSLSKIILIILLPAVLSHAKDQDSFFVSSNLPIVIINTYGQDIVDETRIVAHMGVIDNGPGQRNYLTDSYNDYDGQINIEIRGSSAQMFPKKQYALETQDENGDNLNVSLLGLPPENDWILYAPYSDKSLIRNALTYEISRRMDRYASRSLFCELMLNGDYRGVYVLMEKIKRDSNRVNIARLETENVGGSELTGGYILKIDKLAGENVGGWYSPYHPYPNAWQRIYYQYHYPKPDEITPEQERYIQDFIGHFENTMASENYAEPQSGYANIIDVSSFVDFIIVNEVTKNIDGYRLSTFMYKDRDSRGGKLTMGPVWDFNLAFGNANYFEGSSTEGWQLEFNQPYDFSQIPFWWSRICQDTTFISILNYRWLNLRLDVLSETRLFSVIDSMTTYLSEAEKRNFDRWPVLGTYVWPNAFIGQTYEHEVHYLRDWITSRLKWMDNHLPDHLIDIPDRKPPVAHSAQLLQNYPNPFNRTTTIYYELPEELYVSVKIYDPLGKRVRSLVNQVVQPGYRRITWDGTNDDGIFVSSGVYLYTLHAGGFILGHKMVFIK
ncbi:MAG: CotH kinase family protein [Candidatus Neomarinimicrobiota bacterium]